MSATTKTVIVLAARPQGRPVPSDLRLESAPIAAVGDGEFLVRNLYVSIDPFQRTLMGGGPGEAEPMNIGDPVFAGAVGRVEQSRHPDFAVGDHVVGWFGWQDRGVVAGEGVRKITGDAPLSASLGVLGMVGQTAWVGVTQILKPKVGETVVVSAASGGVGSLAGQIARLNGARVIGITGGAEKVRYLTEELGFDAAVDYKAPDFADQLARAAPDGIDAAFENVGGAVFQAVVANLNMYARVALCGIISTYNSANPEVANDSDLLNVIYWKRLKLNAFAVLKYGELMPKFLEEMGGWLKSGKIVQVEDIVDGLEAIPLAFPRLFNGQTRGKLIAKLA
ncbi:MAG: NADP-dependent oxidoreductase [Bacteroidetes bacterium]|nr:NADP-dependent oxidoreductase [Fibrella sp.]